ncbi:PREDICTED: microtubule-associated protein 70-5 [Ipomoea nil]|uniref:microtubule-associated protein 70-5 n=1 Tax=Ipomoea nil TaxID=35883 RepID=UPI000901DB64|nr:PREDICTED: microtubule-associated protein 70-5 [Ipomoea nil]
MAAGYEEVGVAELCLLHTDPFILELTSLQNQLKEKERELGVAQSENKGLRATEQLKDKALEELGNEVKRLEEKLKISENLVEQKNLETKKLINEKKEALTAQYAAEAALRRVYAEQKEDDSIPIESVIAPLEAEIKMYKNEIAALQEDKRAMERHNKSKEAALLEAERILKSALERVLIVEEVQNQNFELRRQIEICQEENKILDKTNRQKVLEVERLSQTILELEEAILAGGAAANTIRDYRRQISEIQEERRTLERELARVKVSANRVATIVANEWKDENDKVMPVKQWLEERRILQAEMQRLKDKLAISERTAKAEAQLKDKLKLRLKTLEQGLKQTGNNNVNPKVLSGFSKPEKANHLFGILSSKKRSASQPRASMVNTTSEQESSSENSGEYNDQKKRHHGLWYSRNKIDEKENAGMKENSDKLTDSGNFSKNDEDMVSGFLYDRLQKEVINMRKCFDMKENDLNTKDEEIKMLTKKIETLTKAIEVESRKTKREAAIREKDSSTIKYKYDGNIRQTNSSLKSSIKVAKT